MTEPFIGQIILVGFNFAPRSYAFCSGQIMSIAQNTALFSLLGTTYGGDGRTTFALPDLRGRVPIHQGQGPGLANRTMGEMAGSESVTLLTSQLPSHNHAMTGSSAPALADSPAGAAPAVGGAYGLPADTAMAATQPSGSGSPVPSMPPYLVLNYCIAIAGIFPSRN
ncbi:MAG: phage tail protein [Deltaproteobacteria bacterium]|nr:phage tail protein [Deltaproteobacteria bacterium]